MTPRALARRGSALWIAAMIHRISGVALALFLPIHFFVLGLSFRGGARLDTFLRWSDQPLVKFAEGGLVFLLTVHLLGGLRVLIIENFEWRDDLKQLATLASAVAALVSVIFLARMF
ncbi:MAG: succinate dehydrogenase, cytochrome b subunit [Xanthobacteraceae bacterium]